MFIRILIGLQLFLLLLWGCSQGEQLDPPQAPPGVLKAKDQILLGKKLFLAHCAECHGTLAEGRTQRAARFNPPAPDFRERSYRKVDPGYLYRRIEKGRQVEPYLSSGSVMPPWGQYLREEQIWALVAYLLYRNGSDSEG